MSQIVHQYKVIVLGDSAVGKTSLVERLTNGRFSALYKPTIGTDFSTKTFQLSPEITAKLNVLDAAGQLWSQQLNSTYYRSIDCAILVCDMCTPASLNSLQGWLNGILQCCPEPVPLMLVANKLDAQNAVLTQHQLLTAAESLGIPQKNVFQTSAKTGDNVEAAFVKAAWLCYENEARIDKDIETDSFVIKTIKDQPAAPAPQKAGCC